jgi:hypothetical protein
MTLNTHLADQNQGVEQYVKSADAWAPTAATNEWPPPLTSLSSSTVPGSDRLFSRSPSEQLSRVTILLLVLGVFCFVHRSALLHSFDISPTLGP